MVSTRRSSRLQAQSDGSPSPSLEDPAAPSPARGAKRSPRGKGMKQADKAETATAEAAEEIPVEDDSAEEAVAADASERGQALKKAAEDAPEPMGLKEAAEGVSEPKEQKESSEQMQPKEEEEEEEEEEEIILMLDVEDDEEEEEEEKEKEVAVPVDEDAETETDEDAAARTGEEDVAQYALLAASGLDLFGSSGAPSATAPAAASAPKRTAAAVKRSLVPDQLDSGAAQHAAFFAFKGLRHAEGAALLDARRSEEEQGVVQTGVTVVARSEQQRAASRAKTAGGKWFDMASEELTADARRDFALLRMRTYLDPKKFYKSSDHGKKLPTHFQRGVVLEGAHEFKSARLTRKERQQTFTDEVMADAGVRQYTKRVFGQVQAARSGRGKKKARKTHHKR